MTTPSAAAPASRLPVFERLMRRLPGWRGLVVLDLVFLGAYLGGSGGRLRQHSH